ncbi:MAG: hypothetical protein AAFQ07_19955, partial [Chloroflexota bacterium]
YCAGLTMNKSELSFWYWFDKFMQITSKKYTLPISHDMRVDKVKIMNVRSGYHLKRDVTTYISDEQQIQSVINFFEARKSGWWQPWGTLPAGYFTLTLVNDSDDSQNISFSVTGRVVLTFNREEQRHIWRKFDESEYQELILLLGFEVKSDIAGKFIKF